MHVYMAVTADKFELPLVVEENIDILSLKIGIRKDKIMTSISRKRSGKHTGMKFVKVDIVEEGEEQ